MSKRVIKPATKVFPIRMEVSDIEEITKAAKGKRLAASSFARALIREGLDGLKKAAA